MECFTVQSGVIYKVRSRVDLRPRQSDPVRIKAADVSRLQPLLLDMSGLSPLLLRPDNFHVRKFPQMGVHDTGGPLADEKTAVSLDDKGHKMTGGGRCAFAKVRQFVQRDFPERRRRVS